MQTRGVTYHGYAGKGAGLLGIVGAMVVFAATAVGIAGAAQPVEIGLVKGGVGGGGGQRGNLVERPGANVARHDIGCLCPCVRDRW